MLARTDVSKDVHFCWAREIIAALPSQAEILVPVGQARRSFNAVRPVPQPKSSMLSGLFFDCTSRSLGITAETWTSSTAWRKLLSVSYVWLLFVSSGSCVALDYSRLTPTEHTALLSSLFEIPGLKVVVAATQDGSLLSMILRGLFQSKRKNAGRRQGWYRRSW